MRVAPSTATAADSRGLPRARRLRRPAEFGAVLSAGRGRWHNAGEWLAMTAVLFAGPPGARLGITVSKRMARRAIDRNRVKRVIRESFRHRAAALSRVGEAAGARIDVAVRLKRVLPAPRGPHAAQAVPLAAWRGALRAEADRLFDALLARHPAGPR